jgi:hypothetical protein
MLVLNDARLLGNDFLPGKEAILRHRQEHIEPLHDTYRLHDHNDLKDLHKRAGQWMHASELIYRVQKLNPCVYVHQQFNYPDEWGFYVDVQSRLTYVSGFHKAWLREFTAILVDDNNLMAGDELRGWRAVLLKLLSKGILRWPQVLREFGDSEGVNANRWRQHTRIFREDDSDQVINLNLE